MEEFICETLSRLGVTRSYRGYRQVALAVKMVLENEDRMLSITRDLYWPIADALHCSRASIERNIRTVISRVWHTNRKLLIEITTYKIDYPPTSTEFIDIIAHHVRRTYRERKIHTET